MRIPTPLTPRHAKSGAVVRGLVGGKLSERLGLDSMVETLSNWSA